MALRSWLKKQQLFDQYIFEEFQSQNLNSNLPSDLGFVSPQQWKIIQHHILAEKRKDIKDSLTLKRLQQKLDKIGKIMKKERKKQKINNNTNISIENKSNLSPKKAKKAKKLKKKTKAKNGKKIKTKNDKTPNKSNKKIKKQNKLNSNYQTKKLWNPLTFFLIEYWIKLYKLEKKYDTNLRIMVLKYFPLFGCIGVDGDLIVNENETKYLESNRIYDFNSITLLKNSKLTLPKNDIDDNKYNGRLYLSCFNTITMNEGSKITVKGRGEKGFSGGDCSGGIYGRSGRCRNIANIINNDDLLLGVGGAGSLQWATFREYKGGNGGGILKIECRNLIINNNCRISANGCNSDDGAGSGGIIWLKCLKFTNNGKKTAIISCKGGKPNGDDGRIRIDTVNQKEKAKILKIVQCRNVHFGGKPN